MKRECHLHCQYPYGEFDITYPHVVSSLLIGIPRISRSICRRMTQIESWYTIGAAFFNIVIYKQITQLLLYISFITDYIVF